MRHEACQHTHGAPPPKPKDYNSDLVKDHARRWRLDARSTDSQTDFRYIDSGTDAQRYSDCKMDRFIDLQSDSRCHSQKDFQRAASQLRHQYIDSQDYRYSDSQPDRHIDFRTDRQCIESQTDNRYIDSQKDRLIDSRTDPQRLDSQPDRRYIDPRTHCQHADSQTDHQCIDSLKDRLIDSRTSHRYLDSQTDCRYIDSRTQYSQTDHQCIDSPRDRFIDSQTDHRYLDSQSDCRYIDSHGDSGRPESFSYLSIVSILLGLARISKSVISVRRSWVMVLWLAWLVVGCGGMSMPMSMSMSADQTDTDTFSSICDESGCFCTSGRITCSCTKPNQAVVVSNLIPPTTSIIQIENCASVEIQKNALRHVKALTQINIANVANLKLNEHSFSWEDSTIHEIYTTPGIHINLTTSQIPTLPTYLFQGRIDSILFDRVEIHRIESYAFTNIVGTERIEFKNSLIKRIDTQAFKKIFLDKVTFTGGVFLEPIPSKAMLDVEIKTEFKMDSLTIDKIHSSAFKIARTKQFYLKNCIINDTEGEAFYIKTTGPVFIFNNIFTTLRTGAFNGLRVDENFLSRYEEQELIFENNTISSYETDALIFNTSSFDPQLDRIKVDLPCTCGNTDKIMNDLIVFSAHYPYQKVKPGPKVEEFLWCQNTKDKNRYKMVKEYRQKTSCLVISTGIPTYILSLGLLIIPIIALGLLYVLWWRKKKLKWLNVPTESPMKNGKHDSMVIMPEGKTYRETELHVIIEKAEPIVEYIPENGPGRKSGQIPPLTSDL